MGGIISDDALDPSVTIEVLQTRNIASGKTFIKFCLGSSSYQTRSCVKENGNHTYKENEEKIVLFRVDHAKEILVQLFKVEKEKENSRSGSRGSGGGSDGGDGGDDDDNDEKEKDEKEKDVFVAQTVIPLEQFRNNQVVNWYLLKDAKKQSAGEVNLDIIYLATKKKVPDSKVTIADVILLRKVFFVYKSFDGETKVFVNQLGEACRARGMDFTDDELKLIVDEIDSIGIKQGVVNFEDFLAVCTGFPAEDVVRIRQSFQAIGGNNKNGTITQKKLGVFYRTRGIDVTDSTLKMIVRSVQSVGRQDGKPKFDGRIDFVEFLVLTVFEKKNEKKDEKKEEKKDREEEGKKDDI